MVRIVSRNEIMFFVGITDYTVGPAEQNTNSNYPDLLSPALHRSVNMGVIRRLQRSFVKIKDFLFLKYFTVNSIYCCMSFAMS